MSILGEESVTLTRYAAGSRGTDGRWVDGVTTTSTILMAVQPFEMNSEEAATLLQGERISDWRTGYTESEVRAANQHSEMQADRITVDSVTYEVRQVSYWRAIMPHYECHMVRVEEQL